MRGKNSPQTSMLFLGSPEQVVPKDHPIRRVKQFADAALRELEGVFDGMYSEGGRQSVPPERLLKASLLMALYTVRSERMFCEQLGYNLLFRWFLDMSMAEAPFDHSTFSKNRARLMEHDVAVQFFVEIVGQARSAGLMSAEHFTVDGTLIEAWASMKSFKKKDSPKGPPSGPGRGNPEANFHGEKRTNETHTSTTDPEAKLMRKGLGKEAKLCFSAHSLMENRNGLLVGLRVDAATGYAERSNALLLLDDAQLTRSRITLGADKGYDTRDFVAGCRERNVTPHIAQHQTKRRSAIDRRTTGHTGYQISQRVRKRVEEIFGWMKTIGGFRRTRYRGIQRTQFAGYLVGCAYNLMRMSRLMKAPT
jgi:transposase